MAYDEELAQQVRDVLVDVPSVAGREVVEKKMFGGLAFLIDGNMAVAASGQGGLMVRVDPSQGQELLATTTARPMEMRGRNLHGWLRVDADDLTDDGALGLWVSRGAGFAAGLPAK